jgi:hypothetical protein
MMPSAEHRNLRASKIGKTVERQPHTVYNGEITPWYDIETRRHTVYDLCNMDTTMGYGRMVFETTLPIECLLDTR